MTDEKMTDKVQAAVPADTGMQPEEKSKIVYEGGGNLAGVQRKKGKGLILDDGRIEAMKEYLSPEELYQDLISRVRRYHPSDDISMIEKAYKLRLSLRIWNWIKKRLRPGSFMMWWKIPS